MSARDENLLPIGEVARRTGVSPRALRFYEEVGLLAPPARRQGGFRLYSEADVHRIERIQRLKSLLGLPLAKVKEMLAAEDLAATAGDAHAAGAGSEERRDHLDAAVASLEEQRAIIERRIAELVMVRAQVDERLAAYRTRLTPSHARRGTMDSGR